MCSRPSYAYVRVFNAPIKSRTERGERARPNEDDGDILSASIEITADSRTRELSADAINFRTLPPPYFRENCSFFCGDV